MRDEYDLLIVGGGLVGGSLALALAGSSLRIAILESQPDEQRLTSAAGDRALALSWGSSQILAQLGVWGEIAPHASAIRHIHVSDRGHFGKVRMHAESSGVPALGYVATARVIEHAIAGALKQARVDIVCPADLVGVMAGPDGVHASVRHHGESVTMAGRLLVGADGGNSTVRRLLEIGQVIRDYGQTAVVTEVDTELPNRGVAYERFTESGPLALLPLGRNRCSVVWTRKHDDADAMASCSNVEFVRALQHAFGYWLGRLELVAPRQCFPLRLIRAEKMQSDRVLLIGNAMHQLHPVAGQGFNLGLRDVASLAEWLIVRCAFNEDIGDAAFLRRYVAARQDDLNSVVRFTNGLVELFSSEIKPLAAGRTIGLLALDHLPPLKRALARHAMGLANRLPRFA